MTLTRTVKLAEKRLLVWVSLICLSVSVQALAQDSSVDAARQMLWDVAKAIEEGQLDTARSQLDRALQIDNPPQDISALISHLEKALADKKGPDSGSGSEKAKLASKLEQASSSQLAAMNTQELKTYLDQLSKAIELLALPAK